ARRRRARRPRAEATAARGAEPSLTPPSGRAARRADASPFRRRSGAGGRRYSSSMGLVRHADAASFLAVAEPELADREEFHNLPLAIARTCVADPMRHAGPNYFAVLDDAGRVGGVATMTSPHRLGLYVAPGSGVAAVAMDLAA